MEPHDKVIPEPNFPEVESVTTATQTPGPTSTHVEPDRLSLSRLLRLDAAAIAATVLTAIAALLAGLIVLYWQPEVYLPNAWDTGFRYWLIAAAYIITLLRLTSAVADRTRGEAALANGFRGTIRVTPYGSSVGLLALLLSTPLWPTVATAIQVNDAGLLATTAVANKAAQLAAPGMLAGMVAGGAIAAVQALRHRMHRQEDAEAKAEVILCPSCVGDGSYGTAVEGQQYRCPECNVLWSPRSDGTPVRTRYGAWIQQAKIRLTSRR